jgi:hypothetical protein
MVEHVLPPRECPVCHTKLDRASNATLEKVAPRVGDITVCIDCGTGLRFGLGLNLTSLTPDQEREMIRELPRYGELLRYVRGHMLKRRRH